jgi:HD-GYP domain-containing protein (c-di-GMP phosphodiesterase class II)
MAPILIYTNKNNHSFVRENKMNKINNEKYFIEIGIALSTEKNHTVLLEKILLAAQEIAQADGGTIYSIVDNSELKFETIINNSMNLHLGGSTKTAIEFDNIPIYIDGKANNQAIVALSAANKEIINIADAYKVNNVDTSAARAMDAITGYRTQSLLTIPMTDHLGELNGVLQLINAQDAQGKTIAFSDNIANTVQALASLAAIVITNKQLIVEMEELFSSFSKLIAKAIDKKSPYTGGHCRRVPEITMMLAKACHDIDKGPLANFTLSAEDFHELSVAAWLHDCGKVATPEYVMDKSTKLQTVFDRIELIEAKFEIAAQNIRYSSTLTEQEKNDQLATLQDDRQFIRMANTGGEFFDDDKIARVYSIAEQYQITINQQRQSVLSDNEVYNLITKRGTLTAEERKIINGHMDVTVEMLESMKFPKHLQRVPEFACGHHEKMDGTGYPKGLTRDQMSKPARMMAIADIFEALTAADRPYKPAKTLSETLRIMGFMKLDDHIDPELFDVFIDQKVYLDFAEKFLQPSQIDDFNIADIPGYVLPENRIN